MKELKNTLDLEKYLINDLKTEEDFKLYLNASLKDYLEDGDFNSFCRALEIVIKRFCKQFCKKSWYVSNTSI